MTNLSANPFLFSRQVLTCSADSPTRPATTPTAALTRLVIQVWCEQFSVALLSVVPTRDEEDAILPASLTQT